MGGSYYSGPNYKKISGSDFKQQLNLTTPHSIDLVRKLVIPETSMVSPDIKKIVNTSLGGRSFEQNELKSPEFYINSSSNVETHIHDPRISINQLYDRYRFSRGTRSLGTLTIGTPIHQLEDRVMDSNGKAHYFDQLPEVKELQYRFSLLAQANEAKNDDDFKNIKKNLKTHLDTTHKQDFSLLDDSNKNNTSPVLDPSRQQSFGLQIHAPGAFTIHEISENPNSESPWDEKRTERIIDPYEHVNSNISQKLKEHKNEGLNEHMQGLISAYNQLWDKLGSGEYTRHPNFWSGHTFAAGEDRNSAWSKINQSLTGNNDIFRKSE